MRFKFLHHFSCCAPFVLRIHLFHRVTLHLLRCIAAQYASFAPSRASLCHVTFLSFTASSAIWSSSYQTPQPLFCRCCGAMPPAFSRIPLAPKSGGSKNSLPSRLSTSSTNVT